jgi:hypothetical protein
MPSSAANGAQTCTISTEHTLATITTAGVYQLEIDLTNMANGDVLEVRAKMKVLTGGSAIEFLLGQYANVQSQKGAVSVPLASLYSLAFTVKQTAGTGRVFDFNIVRLDA